MPKGISVITSVYNDSYLLSDFIEAFEVKFKEINLQDYEIVIVDDGSDMKFVEASRLITSKHRQVKFIELSRNFGQHIALAAALDFVKFEVVVRCNLDLQDSLEQFEVMYKLVLKGNDLVIGQYPKRNDKYLITRTSVFFYRAISFLSGFDYQLNTSSLRFYGKFYIDTHRSLNEHNRLPQALDAWLGFKPVFVSINHQPRLKGKSSYNLRSRIRLAVDAIFYFSNRPLKFLFYSGITLSFISFSALVFILISARYISLLPGYASLVSLISLGIGLQAIIFGTFGIYLSNIFDEVRQRPLYLAKSHSQGVNGES